MTLLDHLLTFLQDHARLPSRAELASLGGTSERAARSALDAYRLQHPDTPRHPQARDGRKGAQAFGPPPAVTLGGPQAFAIDDDQPEIIGATPGTRKARSAEEVKAALLNAQARSERQRLARDTQRIVFRRGPIGITYQSDHHIGGENVDYRALFADQQIIRDTPGLYVVSQGDETNNFIVSKLERARREAPITIGEEDDTLRAYWAGYGDKLLAIVLGNHNGWAYKLGGRDPFFNLAPAHVLFDPQEVKFTLEVNGQPHRHILRHKVRGSSMYNTLHGGKQHVRMRENADIVIAGHIHRGACYEVWYDRGERKIAGSLGTYKSHDEYDREEGFLGGGQGRTLTNIFDGKGNVHPFDCLATAADFLVFLRRRE